MTFSPQDPKFEKRCRQAFANQSTMASLGVKIVEIEAGLVTFDMPQHPEFSQQHGFLHGGIIATVLDSACGFSAMSLLPSDGEILTIEFKTNFLRPAKGEIFRFRGHVVKAGRTVTFAEAEAFALAGEREIEIARMSATMMAVYDRADVQQRHVKTEA
ncbi:MAG: PaaI family thioesterase [Pseudomonadota bacterium]